MLSQEENVLLTRVAPGTPGGDLLRRYWFPIAVAPELDEEPVKRVRILGEDLVLYRDRGARLGLIGARCVHRSAPMAYGIPEDEGLRCAYHGWLYDHTGQCLEQPAEDMGGQDSTFKERTRIPAYPVEELGGLIFAYLGPEPAPLVPRWGPFVAENVVRSIGWTLLPCNWVQCMENSLDPVHVEYLHGKFDNFVLDKLGRVHQHYPVLHHQKIGFDLFEYGIIKRRVYQGGTENDVEWRIGHPILFPNMLSTGGLEIRVPVDDSHTLQFFYYTRPIPAGVEVPERLKVTTFEAPLPGLDEHDRPAWSLLDNNSGQDMLMFYGPGQLSTDRRERLGISDAGIIFFRKFLREQIELVMDGGEPMNVFRDAAANACLKIPDESDEGGIAERRLRKVGGRPPNGGAQQYAPIYSGEVQLLFAGASEPTAISLTPTADVS